MGWGGDDRERKSDEGWRGEKEVKKVRKEQEVREGSTNYLIAEG